MKRPGLIATMLIGLASTGLALAIWGLGHASGFTGLGRMKRGAAELDLDRLGSQPFDGAPRPDATPTLRLAVAPMLSPERSLARYRRLARYLQHLVGAPVQLLPRSTYEEVNALLRLGYADAAFVCTFPFVQGERDFGLRAIAAPRVSGGSTYRSYVITRSGLSAKSLANLRGMRFASASLLSHSGWIYPAHWLRERGHDPARFFSRHVIAGSHDRAVRAVLQGEADAAAVQSFAFDQMVKESPELDRMLRVLQRSPPFGTPPVVVRPWLARETRDKLQNALLKAHLCPEGREALRPLGVDAFVEPDPRLYDTARQMLRDLERPR